jgi:mannose-6-phosphate isomerase-like protein (cupin superfamily)
VGTITTMADVVHRKIDQIDAIEGFFERLSMRRVGADLGVSSFGISIEEFGPNADEYPEHDHSPAGLGGEMFAERPQQLDQEEVYAVLSGSGVLEADGERFDLDPDHIVRVGPGVKRKIFAGPDGLRLLALGATPGVAYETGDTL